MLYFIFASGKLEAVTETLTQEQRAENRYLTRNDFDSFGRAEDIAEAATKLTGELHIATDSGAYVSPRYDVIRAPKVGDEVSYAFNGDYYPCGTITRVSKTLGVIMTSEGRQFYRRKQTGKWMNGGTWTLVQGHRSEKNPSF